MTEYRIVKVVNTATQEREEREHITVDSKTRYEVQERQKLFFIKTPWNTVYIHVSLKSAIREVEDMQEKYITKTVVAIG